MPDGPEPDCAQAVAWYATDDHPRGRDPDPIFEVVGSMVYPGAGHPSGASVRPWYQVRTGLAYPVDGHPSGASAEPAFRVVDGNVHPASADGLTTDVPAWFEVRADR